MEWLADNWIWVVIAVLFFGVHMLGHGGHGGHGGHDDGPRREPEPGGDGKRKPAGPADRSGHTH